MLWKSGQHVIVEILRNSVCGIKSGTYLIFLFLSNFDFFNITTDNGDSKYEIIFEL